MKHLTFFPISAELHPFQEREKEQGEESGVDKERERNKIFLKALLYLLKERKDFGEEYDPLCFKGKGP